MGIVGKIKRFARKTPGLYHAAESLRRRFEKKTSFGKAIRNMYHPVNSASSYSSSAANVYGHTGSIVGRY